MRSLFVRGPFLRRASTFVYSALPSSTSFSALICSIFFHPYFAASFSDWARLRDKLEYNEISETEYYLKEVKYPINPTDPNKEYTVSLNLDDEDQLLVQNMNDNDDAKDTAELLKDLFPDFSYVKRKRKPM